MEHGLVVVQIALTYYRVTTFVGWLRRLRGDEWELVPGARIISRKSGVAAKWNGFDELATYGLGDRYDIHPPMEKKEPLHRIKVGRCKPATLEVWLPHVPKPPGWIDQ